MESAEVDTGFDRAPDAPPQDTEVLHDREHAVIDTVLVVSTPACLPAGHNVGDVLVYAVRNAGGILHGPKYNRARRKAPAAKHRNATSRRGPSNNFSSPYG